MPGLHLRGFFHSLPAIPHLFTPCYVLQTQWLLVLTYLQNSFQFLGEQTQTLFLHTQQMLVSLCFHLTRPKG